MNFCFVHQQISWKERVDQNEGNLISITTIYLIDKTYAWQYFHRNAFTISFAIWVIRYSMRKMYYCQMACAAWLETTALSKSVHNSPFVSILTPSIIGTSLSTHTVMLQAVGPAAYDTSMYSVLYQRFTNIHRVLLRNRGNRLCTPESISYLEINRISTGKNRHYSKLR